MASVATRVVALPCGRLIIEVVDEAIHAIRFSEAPAAHAGDSAVADRAADWLVAYGRAPLPRPDLPLATRGTDFQRQVWETLLQIPSGRTWSYGELARRVGRPQGAQAVGAANGANPWAVLVPCHRVVGSDGALVGYAGGLERKRWLLAHEGGISGMLF